MAAPWSELITGAVGLAGIGGTLWSGNRTRAADSERDWTTEKRRIYARFQTACQAVFRARVNHDEAASKAEREIAHTRFDDVTLELNLAFNEVWLIAPVTVQQPAMHLLYYLEHGDSTEEDWANKLADLQAESIAAMRTDLRID